VRSFFVATTLAFSLALAAPAAAQPDAREQQIARQLFDEGVSLMKDGRYNEACTKLEGSLKHYPGIGTRGKLADCYEKLGKFVSAWTLWREVAQLAMRAGEPTREQVASEHAKALEPKLSYVTVTVAAANDAPGLIIKRNGQELDRTKLGSAEPVDAGAVAFEITAPGKKPFSAQVNLAPGQSAKFEVPALESAGSATPPPPPPPPGGDTGPVVQVQNDERTWQRPLGLGLAAVGVVGVGVGAFFGLSAKSTYDKAFGDGGGCDKATKVCNPSGQSSVDDARSKATISTVAFIAGAAFVAGGAFLFFTAPSSSSKRAGKIQLVPSPTGVVVLGAM
jgi:hypothetical protein